MKRLGLFDKIIFLVNSIFATALLLAYLLPYIPPKTFPILAILSLGVPVLLIFNAVFLVFWLIKLKRQFLLSLLVLVLGLNHIFSFYKFTSAATKNDKNTIKLLSYNVRQFNRYRWIDSDTITEQIIHFIDEQSPQVVCLQEYYQRNALKFEKFPEQYVKLKGKGSTSGQAILSKLPILNKGSLDFKDTPNNAIYADILMGKDTVRVFNIHLESLKINPKFEELKREASDKLLVRVGESFSLQQDQVELITKSINESPYKCIICGDLNNSAYSYVYRKLSENFKDAFKVAGSGFGKTFVFDVIPLRIDVFLVDPTLTIDRFTSYSDVELSDHYPISMQISIPD